MVSASLKYIKYLIISISIIALLSSCAKNNEENPIKGAVGENTLSLKVHKKDGLEILYPDYWKLTFDDAPDFSADTWAVFDVTELSRITVARSTDKDLTVQKVADVYEKRLGLLRDSSIGNYKRQAIKFAGKSALQLTWQRTEFFTRKVELTLVEVFNGATKVFVFADLDHEDVASEKQNVIELVSNIKFY